jgi:hypothetical protein
LKVSAAITSMMSEICITSSRAATRGMMFLPLVVAGAISVSYPSASDTTSAASGSASRFVASPSA